jgi:hypothetical protein
LLRYFFCFFIGTITRFGQHFFVFGIPRRRNIKRSLLFIYQSVAIGLILFKVLLGVEFFINFCLVLKHAVHVNRKYFIRVIVIRHCIPKCNVHFVDIIECVLRYVLVTFAYKKISNNFFKVLPLTSSDNGP